ncbi:MAG: hypothetical protein CMI31_02080 [Opitutae bacterium]|nr:hypothetical protein [Opitutae bacterium]|tara:strand:+ start:1093 stop:1287 length:195 start_codon:yes stop_codon:yes gene_type:complete
MEKIQQALRIITGGEQGDIREALATLDQALLDQADEMDGQLVHFLERRSYVKALAFVSGEEAPE